MSHIVVLSSIYLGKASTNGLCANNIVNALSTLGHDVDVICCSSADYDNDNKHIYTVDCENKVSKGIDASRWGRLIKLIYLLKSDSRCFLEQYKVDLYLEKLLEIERIRKVDVVIGMFFPMETAETLRRFKICCPNVNTIVYELDSIFDGVARSNLFHVLFKHSYLKWLLSVYDIVDDVIVMKSHSESWQNTFSKKYGCKLHVADIPVLLPSINTRRSDTGISFIYAGLIEKKYRSPEYLLSVLYQLNNMIDFRFAFYSKGDCEEMISNAAKCIHGIKQMGYVTKEELETAMNNSSILVSIGNSISNSVPSKLISYISYKKPIIHFSSQKDDVCLSYLNEYPLSLVIHQNDTIPESCKRIVDFVENIDRLNIANLAIEELFKMNTPYYSANLINSIIPKCSDGKC